VTQVPKSTDAEMEAAVASCKDAFQTWSKTTVLTRQQAMFKLQHLIKANMVSMNNLLFPTSMVGWLRGTVVKCQSLAGELSVPHSTCS